MAITAAQVKELREMTGAGIMDCKKALTKTNGDFDAAIEELRKVAGAKVEKKASRIAAEGLSYAVQSEDGRTAAVVEVNSETDFVASNEKFKNFVSGVAQQALASNATSVEEMKAEQWNQNPAQTVDEALTELIGVISEKLSIRRFQKVTTDGVVATYVHGGGRIAVIVDCAATVVNDEIKEAVRNVAMQVAALSPKYVRPEDIDQATRDHELAILVEQAKNDPKNANKPENILEKMVTGRLNKEFKEVCLEDQVYVKAEDGKQSVKDYLNQVGKKNGTELKINRFVRFETGEGMEHREENFAKEVMDQIQK